MGADKNRDRAKRLEPKSETEPQGEARRARDEVNSKRTEPKSEASRAKQS
jgi:hypothetical protein